MPDGNESDETVAYWPITEEPGIEQPVNRPVGQDVKPKPQLRSLRPTRKPKTKPAKLEPVKR